MNSSSFISRVSFEEREEKEEALVTPEGIFAQLGYRYCSQEF